MKGTKVICHSLNGNVEYEIIDVIMVADTKRIRVPSGRGGTYESESAVSVTAYLGKSASGNVRVIHPSQIDEISG